MIKMMGVTDPKTNYTYDVLYADVIAVTIVAEQEAASITANFYASEDKKAEPVTQGQINMPYDGATLLHGASAFLTALSEAPEEQADDVQTVE